MKILALDSSAVSASAAVLDDDKVLGEFFINTKQTHSQTPVSYTHLDVYKRQR